MHIDVDFWHFLPYRYVWSLLSSKKLHFRNVAGYLESNVVRVDNKSYLSGDIGYFSFTQDVEAIGKSYFWKTYADDGFGVAVGFRNAGFRRDSGPNAAGIKSVAMQSAGKPVTNLYLPSKEEGRIVKCYYAMVFYEKDDTIHKETLTTLSADDLCDFRDLCFTCKPSGDSPDHEERLVVLDCPATRDIDFSTMYPGLYPNGIALGYGLPPHFKQTIRDIYGAHFRMYETTFNWKANSISVALDRHGFGVSLNVFAISDKP